MIPMEKAIDDAKFKVAIFLQKFKHFTIITNIKKVIID